MNWRELLAEPRGATTKNKIHNIHKTAPKKGGYMNIVDYVDIVPVSRPLEVIPDALGNERFEQSYFVSAYKRLSKFSSHGRAIDWFQDHSPEACAKLTSLYFAAQRDPNDKAKVVQWARVELRAYRQYRTSKTGKT